MIKVKYDDIKYHIKEGDVLLFRGNTWFSNIISIASQSIYTHVGVASWHDRENGLLECVEFKEWVGGRAVNLDIVVKDNLELIDVYRPAPYAIHYFYKQCHIYQKVKHFNGKALTDTMRKMAGLPYGWTRIWWIAQYHMAFLRIFQDLSSTTCDDLKDIIYPVCSTAVAYAFSASSYDLVNNKSDEWTEPGDISRSKLLSYLFTLC